MSLVCNYRFEAAGPAVKCEFIGLCTALGEPVVKLVGRIPYGLRARVKRLSEHPRLGEADNHDFTITSELRTICFEQGIIVTQNTIYMFEVE